MTFAQHIYYLAKNSNIPIIKELYYELLNHPSFNPFVYNDYEGIKGFMEEYAFCDAMLNALDEAEKTYVH